MHRSVVRGIALIILLVAIIVAFLFIPKQPGKNAQNHPPNNDPWKLVSYDPDNPAGTYLGNGFIGCRIMGEGADNHDGQPLPCYMAGLYDNEKLITTPTWHDLRFYVDGKTEFKIDKTADYKQVLDMKQGILTTYATWRAGRKTLKGKIEVIVSRAKPNVGIMRAVLVPSFSSPMSGPRIQVGAPLGENTRGETSPGGFRYYIGTQQDGRPVAIARCIVRDYGGVNATQVSSIRAEKGSSIALTSYIVVVADTDLSIAETKAVGILDDVVNTYSDLIKAHKAAMANFWKRDIIIDGPKRDQQAIHSCMFYLLQSVREGSQWSIPPMGLSNNAFNGHVFWDADLWMFPALILQHPELAKSIVDYRYNTLPGAMANAKEHGFTGAEYAWESGQTGKEDTPPGLSYRYERHINGDIALCHWQYYLATGDINWLKSRGYPVLKSTSDYWVSRAKWIPEKGRYEILQVVPPDEIAEIINNSAYTNIIAQLNLRLAIEAAKRIGAAPNPKWAEVADKMYIPYDAKNKRFKAFDSYNPRMKAKQADTELIVYPLQYKLANQPMDDIYKNTFEYYSRRVHVNGPAMSTSAYAVIASRLGDCDRAYSEFVKSYKPYFRGPFNYFNEKATKTIQNDCFLTGAAGPIQSAIFGLAGANVDYFASDDNQILSWSPCLPKQWESIKLTGVRWRGKTFDVTVSKGNKVRVESKS